MNITFLGEEHYNCASALQKSIRGSDDNAAVYWLSRMLEGGEDPRFIARRLVVIASEDVGKVFCYLSLFPSLSPSPSPFTPPLHPLTETRIKLLYTGYPGS